MAKGVVLYRCMWHFFFFQAEDGIRDLIVTGVQTCALPIFGEFQANRTAHVIVAIEGAAKRSPAVAAGQDHGARKEHKRYAKVAVARHPSSVTVERRVPSHL